VCRTNGTIQTYVTLFFTPVSSRRPKSFVQHWDLGNQEPLPGKTPGSNRRSFLRCHRSAIRYGMKHASCVTKYRPPGRLVTNNSHPAATARMKKNLLQDLGTNRNSERSSHEVLKQSKLRYAAEFDSAGPSPPPPPHAQSAITATSNSREPASSAEDRPARFDRSYDHRTTLDRSPHVE